MLKLVSKYLNELSRAEEFIRAAKENISFSLRTSANRMYFALERVVVSYLLFKEIEVPLNHQKLWEVAAVNLGEDYYNCLRELYDLRMQADYGFSSNIVKLNKEVVKKYIVKIEFYIHEIKNKIKNKEK